MAVYFVKARSVKHSVVGHLGFNKMNNAAGNLRWMEPEENYAHQQLSLHVIREKKERVTTYRRYTPQRQAFAGEKIQGYQNANTGDQTGGIVGSM